MFKYNKYIQPPSMRRKYTLENYWDNCNEVVPGKVIRRTIRDILHDTIQEKLDLEDYNYCLVSKERFNGYLDSI